MRLQMGPCLHGEEEFHRGGQCCDQSSMPFPIGYKSYIGEDLTRNQKECEAMIPDISVGLKVPETMRSNLAEIVIIKKNFASVRVRQHDE
jgi:hypothetical protein